LFYINFGLFFEPQAGGSGDQSLDYKKIKPHFFNHNEGWGFIILKELAILFLTIQTYKLRMSRKYPGNTTQWPLFSHP